MNCIQVVDKHDNLLVPWKQSWCVNTKYRRPSCERCRSIAEMEGFDSTKVLLRSSLQQADVHRTSAFKLFKSLIGTKKNHTPQGGVVLFVVSVHFRYRFGSLQFLRLFRSQVSTILKNQMR